MLKNTRLNILESIDVIIVSPGNGPKSRDVQFIKMQDKKKKKNKTDFLCLSVIQLKKASGEKVTPNTLS